jgi:hypothetical protein
MQVSKTLSFSIEVFAALLSSLDVALELRGILGNQH